MSKNGFVQMHLLFQKTIMDKIQKIDYSDTYNILDIIPNNITQKAFINNSYFSEGLTNFLLDWFEKIVAFKV